MSNISGDTFFIENSVNCSDLGSLNGQVIFIDTSTNCGEVLNAFFSGNGTRNDGQVYGCTVFCNSANYGYVCGTGILRGTSVLYGGADCVILCDQSTIDGGASVNDFNLLVTTYPCASNIYCADNCYYVYESGVSTLANGLWSGGYYCSGNNAVSSPRFKPLLSCDYSGALHLLRPAQYNVDQLWYENTFNLSSAEHVQGGLQYFTYPVYSCLANGVYDNYIFCSGVIQNITSCYLLPKKIILANGWDLPYAQPYGIYVSGASIGCLSGVYITCTGLYNYNNEHHGCFFIDGCINYSTGTFQDFVGRQLIRNSKDIFGKDLYALVCISNPETSPTLGIRLDLNLFYSDIAMWPFVSINAGNWGPIYEKDLNYYSCSPRLAEDTCLFYIYQSGLVNLASDGPYCNVYIKSGNVDTCQSTIFNQTFPEMALDDGCYYYYESGCYVDLKWCGYNHVEYPYSNGIAKDPFLLKKVFNDVPNSRIEAYLRDCDVPNFIEAAVGPYQVHYFDSGNYGTGVCPTILTGDLGINPNPFVNKDCSKAYFISYVGEYHFENVNQTICCSTPMPARTDVYLNNLDGCALLDKRFFVFNCGVGTPAVGFYSNGSFIDGCVDVTAYPTASPVSAIDNGCYYVYICGTYEVCIANGPYITCYFTNGVFDPSYTNITPQPVFRPDTSETFYILYREGIGCAPCGLYSNAALLCGCGVIDYGYNCLLPQQPIDDIEVVNSCPGCIPKWYVYTGGTGYGATGAYSSFYFASDFTQDITYTCTGLGSPQAAQDDTKYYEYCEGCPFIVIGCRNDVFGYDAYPTGIYNFGDNGENNPNPCFIEILNGPYIYTYYCFGVPNSATGIVSFCPTYANICCGPDLGYFSEGKYTWIYHSTLCCGFDPTSLGYPSQGCGSFDRLTVTLLTESSCNDTCCCWYYCNNQVCCHGIVMIDNRFYTSLYDKTPYNSVVCMQYVCNTCWACCDLFCNVYCTCTFDLYCNLYCDVYNTEDPPVCIGQECCGQECCGSDSCQVCCGQECCGSEVICNYSCIYWDAFSFNDGYITGCHHYCCILQGETVICDETSFIYDDGNGSLMYAARTNFGGPNGQINFIDLV